MPDDRPVSPEERKIETIREGMRLHGYSYGAIERAVAALSTPAGPSPEPRDNVGGLDGVGAERARTDALSDAPSPREAVEATEAQIEAARKAGLGHPDASLTASKVQAMLAAALSAARPSSPTPFTDALNADVVIPGLERAGALSAAEVLALCDWFDRAATTKEGR